MLNPQVWFLTFSPAADSALSTGARCQQAVCFGLQGGAWDGRGPLAGDGVEQGGLCSL